MNNRCFAALAILLLASPVARAAEPYPFAGVFSILEAESEKHFGMDKFTCLASLVVQRPDGSYTAYHVSMEKLGAEGKAEFHPYETGICEYSSVKKLESCAVTKSSHGQYKYLADHQGETDGVTRLAIVDLRNPSQVNISIMRKCPFDEARLAPHLSEQWLNYSDEDFSWVIYRYLPFNLDLAAKAAKDLGVSP